MESFKQTLEKINIDLKGKPIFTIILNLILIIVFILFEIFLKNENNFRSPVFYPSTYKVDFDGSHYIYASSIGTKYYFYSCKSSIKEDNKIYFKSEDEAKVAGYSLAKACQ